MNDLLAHVETANEVCRYADFVETKHNAFGNAVVEHALTGNRAFPTPAGGGGVVLEMEDDRARLRSLEQVLGLAFVEPSASGHM